MKSNDVCCAFPGTMRRLEDAEQPLPLCLSWTCDGVEGLDRRKFILQENDTGEIMVRYRHYSRTWQIG